MYGYIWQSDLIKVSVVFTEYLLFWEIEHLHLQALLGNEYLSSNGHTIQ